MIIISSKHAYWKSGIIDYALSVSEIKINKRLISGFLFCGIPSNMSFRQDLNIKLYEIQMMLCRMDSRKKHSKKLFLASICQ